MPKALRYPNRMMSILAVALASSTMIRKSVSPLAVSSTYVLSSFTRTKLVHRRKFGSLTAPTTNPDRYVYLNCNFSLAGVAMLSVHHCLSTNSSRCPIRCTTLLLCRFLTCCINDEQKLPRFDSACILLDKFSYEQSTSTTNLR